MGADHIIGYRLRWVQPIRYVVLKIEMRRTGNYHSRFELLIIDR